MGLNESLFYAIKSVSSTPLDYFFLFVTTFGNPVFWIFISAILFWKGEEKESFFLMNTIVASALFVGFFKSFFKVPRPGKAFQTAKSILHHNFSLPADQFSFPSGHATAVSAAFAFFYKKIKKNWKIVFGVIVVLVLISRVYLGKHFPIDVIIGLAIGLATGFGAIRFNKWFESRPKTNTQNQRQFLIVIIGMLFLAVIFLFEQFAVVALPLGYYLGLFLFKELERDTQKIKGKKFFKKTFTGLFGLGIIFLSLLLIPLEQAMQAILFFLAGIWITLLYPTLFEIIALKKKTITK